MKRSLILDTSIRLVYHPLLLLSLYLLFAGHNQPGGGFVGGLVAGAAVALRFIAGGVDDVRAAVAAQPWHLLGAGLLIAGGAALTPVVLGRGALESHKVEWHVRWLGTIKSSSTLVFDIGVYLIVVGLVLMMFEAFGEPPAAIAEEGDTP